MALTNGHLPLLRQHNHNTATNYRDIDTFKTVGHHRYDDNREQRRSESKFSCVFALATRPGIATHTATKSSFILGVLLRKGTNFHFLSTNYIVITLFIFLYSKQDNTGNTPATGRQTPGALVA